jgi:putative tryptophan/tyrosine transport system substrate-binding protein
MNRVERRRFLIVAGTFLVAPLVRAQAPRLPLVGYLNNSSGNEMSHLAAAFHRGLAEEGYVDGKNVSIEFLWADGRPDRIPGFAADLVRRHAAVIVATGGSPTWVPARAATTTVPIVFSGGSDPVKLGLVASLGRPGGNATGVTSNSIELAAKRLQLLRELVPAATVISVLVNVTKDLDADEQVKEMRATARAIGQQIVIVNARGERDFDAAFAKIVRKPAAALLVAPASFFVSKRAQLVTLAAKHAIPACYAFAEYVDAGGLMSYGDKPTERSRLTGIYTGKILKGAKPADLPVLQPTTFEFALNSKTAKALGIKIPGSLLARADRVIE